MTIEFGKYWFKLVMINMDNFEIHYDGMIIKELTYIEMKDLTETMSELAEHVKREREAASKNDIHNHIWNEAIEHAAMWAGSRPIKEVTNLKDHEKALLVQAAFVYIAGEIRKLRK